MEGIIRFLGTIAGIGYQHDGTITVKLKYKEMILCKQGEEADQIFDEDQCIVLPYHGAVRLDAKTEKEFGFRSDVANTTYGVGVAASELYVGDEVLAYVRWRQTQNFSDMPDPPKHLVPEEVVISPLKERPEQLHAFLQRVIVPTL